MATVDPTIAANPTITPYVWEAVKGGVIYATEYPPGATPETSFDSIGFTLRWRGDDARQVPTFVNTIGETVTFRAVSLREATCPMLEIDIAAGDALIWGHRRVHTVVAFMVDPTPLSNSTISYETMLFGRETVGGEVQIAQIWPGGQTNGFSSYDEAMSAL